MKKIMSAFNIIFSIIINLIGGFDSLIKSLIIIIIDYITGVIKAVHEKKFKISINIVGLLKKGCYLIIVVLASIFDNIIIGNSMALRTLVIYFFIANDSISIIENLSYIGLPIPNRLYNIISKIKDENN